MPSLLSRVALSALAGSGGHPRRRLQTDASLTPCTHNICGRRTLALPEYTAGSATPQSLAGFEQDGKLMTLKTILYNTNENQDSEGTIKRVGDNLVVSVKFPEMGTPADHACVLGVEVAHDPGNSDATLQHAPNEYQADDPVTGEYTGATSLAQPTTYPDCSDGCVAANYTNTMQVTITPSSYPHRYEDNFGAKLHVGRLGITVKPYLLCSGLSAPSNQKNKKVYLEENFVDESDITGVSAHPIYYDLVAKGDTLTSKDEAGAISGQLKTATGETAKRLYDYSAAFVHYHDQVRFPNASIASKSYDEHFDTPSASLQSAMCEWDHGELHDDLTSSRADLEANGWMTPNDAVAPEAAYGDWTADECADGVCAKYRKDTTVAHATAYLPFDKPLPAYYKSGKAPKVMCKSQKDTDGATPEGALVTSETNPDLENDDAAAIFSNIVTSFNSVTNVICTIEGLTDVCDTLGQDTMVVKGQVFDYARVVQDFTDLLGDQYDFRTSYSCVSSRSGTDATDECTISNGADDAVKKLTSLKRVDNGVDLKNQLEAKAQAVEGIEFSVPTKYGTTFNAFKLTLSAETEAISSHKYRATGDFRVNVQLLDSEATQGQESVQWTGGDVITEKEFEGYETTTRFVKRQPAINRQIRVENSVLTGYYVSNALFAETAVDENNTVGIMSPFVHYNDIAGHSDELKGLSDDVTQAMSAANKYSAVKSYCCGVDSATVDGSLVDCTTMNKAGSTESVGASVYCRANGFDAVRCLGSTLDVKYTVKTQSLDSRFEEVEVIATKIYNKPATPSLDQQSAGFTVQNAEFNAQTVGAGEQAGADVFSYEIQSTSMGSARDGFTRDKPADEVVTYNCESAGRTVTYRTTIPTPCGESDRNEVDPYSFEAYVTAHYVYTKGTNDTPDQVSQVTATATIAGKTRAYGAVLRDNGQHWETEEWRVQDSSDPTSDAKGSGSPLKLKVIISNDETVADYDGDLHMPASKVFIDESTLSVALGPGSVELHECKTEGAETFCILHYTNDEIMSIDAGKYCGDLGADDAEGGFNENADQPACPVISYKVAARVLSGMHADGFGHGASCGVQSEEVPLTYIGDERSHTLFVYGNDRAYDGVLDIHVVERDEDCKAYCGRAFGDAYADQKCHDVTQFPDDYDGQGWKRPELNEGETYCRNPYPIAEEDIHNVAVPGRNGAAQTNLNPNVLGALSTSKDLTFEVRYFQIGNGPRKFTIDGLTENIPVGLPAPIVCSSTSYGEPSGCVRPEFTVDDSDASQQSLSANGCLDGSESCAEIEEQMKISKFYLALGSDKTFDVCSNTNVGDDPYTIDNGDGTTTLTLGFSIKVEYLTNTASGEPDDDVEHKFYFQLQCPQKAYSMNLVQFGRDASAQRKNIPANADIGLVDKLLYAESHYKFLKVLGYFAGRSTDRYDPNNGNVKCTDATDTSCRKAAVRMVDNDFVQFKGGVSEIFLDTADDFDHVAEIEFEFKQACLFTTITVISKITPFDSDGNFITNTQGDTQFSFRVQCPRWREDASSDSLILHYDVEETTFTGTGGSVTVKQPLIDADQINSFTSITTSLKGDLCQGDLPETECTFDGTTAPGASTTLEKQGTQQAWLDYLKDTCGFTLNQDTGNYVGFMERVYQRKNLDFDANGGTQTYCSGRKLSFGIETQGTHTATIRVDAPMEMDFAVQIDDLKWQECAGADEYQLVAQATLYRRQYTTLNSNQPWYKATSTHFTDIVSSNTFFGGDSDPSISVSGGVMTITGACQAVDDSGGADDNCADFEAEREVDFGVVYSQFGVDYRASLGIDMQMTCPRGTKQGSDSAGVALRHTTECSDYEASTMSGCPIDNSDGGDGLYYVGANGQIRLTLIIDDTAFQDHIVSPPTYKVVAGTLADAPQQGSVADLCSALEADCMFRASDGANDIALVTARTYPTDPVNINGVDYDFSARDAEENSVITLRALPLSDTTVEITWVVDRVLESTGERRRLRMGYSLGAAAAESSRGEDGLAFKVLPATREEEAGIAASGTEEIAEEPANVATQQSGASHAETKKDDKKDDSSTLTTVIIVAAVLVGGIFFIMVVKRRGDEKREEAGAGSSAGSSGEPTFLKSRFYQYSHLSKGEDMHIENLWKRNRFQQSSSRFL